MRRVLAVLPAYIPSTIINVITPLQALAAEGAMEAVIRTEDAVTPQEVAAADVLVLCRNIEPQYRPIVELALELGIPIIYDLDDYFMAAPRSHDAYAFLNNRPRRTHYEWLLTVSNLVRVYSPVVERHVRDYNANVALVWAAVDWSLVPPELPPLSFDPIHIVYAAQRETGKHLYQYMQPDLVALLEKHGERVRLHFLGYTPPDLCGHPLVICEPFQADYAAFFQRFTRMGYAIGLAPMLPDDFHQGKTNLKYRDYAAAGAAGIYTDCPLYRNGVVDGVTGLFVTGEPGSWLPAIERLLADPSLIASIRQEARRQVAEKHHMAVVTAHWLRHIEELPARPPLSEARAAETAAMTWWFTGYRHRQNAPGVRLLRRILRRALPTNLKLKYYDAVTAIRGRLK